MISAIVIPTYNERGNIKELVTRILHFSIPDLHLIIVDDNSPDGTGDVADELAKMHSCVHVIHRQKKEGLGKAYAAGFRKAFSLSAEAIGTMDADFSHDPERIPFFLKEIAHADMVIGSRYTRGGAIRNWNMMRRCISRMGNLYARTILQTGIRDMTTGYRWYRRHVLETIGIDTLSSSGYVVLVELAYRSFLHNFTIKEIPITFTERASGKSKFSLRIFLEAWMQIVRLKSRKKTLQTTTKG